VAPEIVEVVSDPRRRFEAFKIKVFTVLPTNVEPAMEVTITVDAVKLDVIKEDADNVPYLILEVVMVDANKVLPKKLDAVTEETDNVLPRALLTVSVE